jgi:ATP-binding cassette subfamily C protein PrsD
MQAFGPRDEVLAQILRKQNRPPQIAGAASLKVVGEGQESAS